MARLLPPTAAGIRRAARALIAHEPVALPTETVYGLAARYDSPLSVDQVFRIKGRPKTDPLIVHIPKRWTIATLLRRGFIALGAEWPAAERARLDRVIQRFWPGPLTLVLPRGRAISPVITADRDWVALRMPANPLFQKVLSATGLPLVAPSANRFQSISPTCAQDVADELPDLSWILDGGPSRLGIESTVVWARPGRWTLLRPGVISAQEVAAVARCPVRRSRRSPSVSPGLMARHYAPSKPVVLAQGHRQLLHRAKTLTQSVPGRLGVLVRSPKTAAELRRSLGMSLVVEVADPSGADLPYAASLYRCLRKLDRSACRWLLLEVPRQGGVGARRPSGAIEAIRDRLIRAGGIGAAGL